MTCPHCTNSPAPVCLSNVLRALVRNDWRPWLEDLCMARESLDCAIARREVGDG